MSQSEKLHQPHNQEKYSSETEISPELSKELRKDILERASKHEKLELSGKHEKLEVARNVVEQEAITKEELQLPSNEKKPEPTYFTKTDRERSFNTTMHHVRNQLTKPSQAFSRVIHQKQVEKVSEVAGKTIARPSGVIGAATSALIGVSIVLFLAKRTGFQLSGSEFWILLCIGYLVGLLIEAIRKLFSKKNKLA